MRIGIGLIAFLSLLATGQVVSPEAPYAGSAIQLTALGILTWFVKMHFKELSDARRERELQERQRHEDSAALSGALTNMAVQCAKSQSERQAEKRG